MFWTFLVVVERSISGPWMRTVLIPPNKTCPVFLVRESLYRLNISLWINPLLTRTCGNIGYRVPLLSGLIYIEELEAGRPIPS
jgi:hypothetical protein